MSVELIDAGRRLRAAATGEAVARTATMRTRIEPTAATIAVVQLPGAAAELWGITVGNIYGAAVSRVVADPRPWQSQLELLAFLEEQLCPVLDAARTANKAPQLIVGSNDAWQLLAGWAHRLLATPDDTPGRAVAETMCWADDRHHHPGSIVVVEAATALADHLTTGGTSAEETSLRWMLQWASPSYAAPDYDDDDQCALPLDLEHRHQLNVTLEQVADDTTAATAVGDVVRGVLTDRHKALVAGIAAIRAVGAPELPAVATTAALDASSYGYQRKQQDDGWRRRSRLSDRDERIALVEAEALLSAWESDLIWNDTTARLEAAAEGRVLTATVSDDTNGATTLTADDTSELRFRPGDSVCPLDHPKAPFEVLSVDRDDTRLRVTVRAINHAHRLEGIVELLPKPDTYEWAERSIARARAVIVRPGWAHNTTSDAPSTTRPSRAGRLSAALARRA